MVGSILGGLFVSKLGLKRTLLTGMLSGKVQEMLGYKAFFIGVLLAAIPSILVTVLAPFHHPDAGKQESDG